ncbi:MAG: hypothetical protein F7B06_09545 [Opitutae bacterium]|nr:hypothetical protein [Opitutae bacterium]
MERDRSESYDLVEKRPEVALRLQNAYDQWANRCGVIPWEVAKGFSVYAMARKKAEAEAEGK